MLAGGSGCWFDIWLLGSVVVINNTRAKYNPQSTSQKTYIIYHHRIFRGSFIYYFFPALIVVVQCSVMYEDLSHSQTKGNCLFKRRFN